MSEPQPASSLTGKVALITGASSGIGEATAIAMAQAGAAVALAARRTDRLELLAARLRNDGARVLTLELDVNDQSACARGDCQRPRLSARRPGYPREWYRGFPAACSDYGDHH